MPNLQFARLLHCVSTSNIENTLSIPCTQRQGPTGFDPNAIVIPTTTNKTLAQQQPFPAACLSVSCSQAAHPYPKWTDLLQSLGLMIDQTRVAFSSYCCVSRPAYTDCTCGQRFFELFDLRIVSSETCSTVILHLMYS